MAHLPAVQKRIDEDEAMTDDMDFGPPAEDAPPVDAYDGIAPHADQLRGGHVKPNRDSEVGHAPPHNLEAEEATLGAMMMSSKVIELAEELHLQREHFWRPSHRLVFDAIRELWETVGVVDELTTVTQLRSMNVQSKRGGDTVIALGEVGGPAAVMTLTDRVPSLAGAKQYVQDVVDTATKRRLVEVGHEVARLGYDPTVTVDEGVRGAEAQLLEVSTATGRKHERGQIHDTADSLARWEAAYERRRDPELREQDTLSWGRTEFDEALGRMQAGAVFVPAGWTKHGKTWFVLDVAEAVMEQGHRVLIDSGEMSDTELVDRWMAMGGHDYRRVQEGTVPWSVMAPRREQMAKWQRRTLTGRMALARLRSHVARAKLEGRPFRLVIVDHLGLARPGAGEGRNGRREFVEDYCAEFKAMAEEYGFTGLLVSQLSRPQPDKTAHPKWLRAPIPSDLKEASGIEQIATAVIFVYRHMDRTTGRFSGQDASIALPFHRSLPTARPIACEFKLPRQGSGDAYRFVPVAVDSGGASVEVVQASLEEQFGPGVELVGPPAGEFPF